MGLRAAFTWVRSGEMADEMNDPLYKLNSKIFSQHLNSQFIVHVDGAPSITLELREVNEPPSPPNIEMFSLIFNGPQAPRLNQQIHQLEHAVLGKIGLFLTTVGADQQSTSYESVFHRLRPAAK